ncbi:reverse transcriptase domain-containing protein [Tanacetum coccineum]
MRKAFINRFFPPSLFNRLLLEIRNFSQNICESLTEAWLRLKNMLRKCHGHGLTKGAIIQIFYHGLDEPTQAILDVTAGGIFLYKTPNQAFQFLDDKVLFNHDWPIKSKNEHHRKSVSFADGSNNGDNSRLMEKLEALTVKMDSQIISLNEELQDIRNKYNELKEGNASKNHLNDDTPMCERHEANDIQSEGYQNQNSHDSYSHQSYHDPNDSEKSLTELNNDVKNDLEDFKRCIRSMRTIHDKLFDRDDGKTTGVLPNKISKPINQEPQSKTDFEKLVTKFLDDQRVTSMFFKNNVNDMILKIKQNEKNSQIKIKKMERKMDEWSKSQNISSEQTDKTEPQPPPQAQTEQVNVVFTRSGKSDDSPKTQKDSPPPIIVDNKTKKDKPIKPTKKGYHVIPIVSPTISPSPEYTPSSPDYSPASDMEFDPSEDPLSYHISPLPATSSFLSSTDDSSDSDIPDTPPSPTHGTPFTETTLSTQRSPTAFGALRRRFMILSPG